MSRIGKSPISIPKNVEIKKDGYFLSVKGPKGELKRKIHQKVNVNIDAKQLILSVSDESREAKSLHGLFRSLISNMVSGVTNGFEKILMIEGVGYRAELNGRTAVFNLGYSHPVNYDLPEGIDVKIEKTKITLYGIDKDLLGLTASKIRSFRKPEPYKGKGIRYADEIIRIKAGKAIAK